MNFFLAFIILLSLPVKSSVKFIQPVDSVKLIEKKQIVEEEKCRLQTFSKILFFQRPTKIEHVQDLVKDSNCLKESLWTVFDTIQSIDGKISSKHLNRLIKENDGVIKVDLIPKSVDILHLDNIIATKVFLEKKLNIEKVKVIDPIYAIGLKKLSEVQFECHACNTVGPKNLNITYTRPLSNYRRNIWATIKISKLQKVVVAASDIWPFSGRDLKEDVELLPFNIEDSKQYIRSISDLSYFKVNKYIKKGTPLEHSDLVARKLVRAGKLTQVVVEQDGFKLQIDAIAKQSGKYGDFVHLYNPDSKKKIRGQVIDFNKVRVDI